MKGLLQRKARFIGELFFVVSKGRGFRASLRVNPEPPHLMGDAFQIYMDEDFSFAHSSDRFFVVRPSGLIRFGSAWASRR